ncbi:interleukin-1 receptor type 1-like isoform X3 [Pyxicephalus adspersus]|uniref:Interleukin-1 receptor type 1 n=3 Tax=Pyxicephalus adspersus TaxID=30357 RepID=A0AAV3B946_PYXAD|nr:TPA: hypothetical protein GDO54_000953 [Pyxicephalus adspersus]
MALLMVHKLSFHEPLLVHKMFGQLLIILFLISPNQSCLPSESEKNIDDEVSNLIYIPNGEPYFINCTHQLAVGDNYTITWFKNGSEISTDTQARIHQDGRYLKFFPGWLEDSGFYSCVLRNDENCFQVALEVDVFQNDNGLCYKNEALYRCFQYLGKPQTLQCPCLPDIVDTTTAQFYWFKDCEPLDVTTDKDKYLITKDLLNIKDMTEQDGGNYMCVTSVIHNGNKYNISRSYNCSIHEAPSEQKFFILHPTGNTIDAELGAPVTVTCQALLSDNPILNWMQNNSFISEYSGDNRVIEGETYNTTTNDGQTVLCQDLIFSSVKKEDYGIEFQCYAQTFSKTDMAFFILKQPDPNFHGFLIAFFVTAVFLIITTIIIVKVFKVDIVLWYRSSCFSYPQQNDGKMYDAYIMYPRNAMRSCTYDMDLFVLKLLPEVLEKECGYRLFIIGRDDLPGQAMADLVDEAISQSRRLIVVLGEVSKIFNLGEDFERKIAMYDVLIRNELKVLLIEMEKISDYTLLPESIKYIKQKQGAVRWKGTFTEASLSSSTRFWKNIRYRMPPAPHHSNKQLDYINIED